MSLSGSRVLIKTSFLNAIAVAVRIGTALFLNKILALIVGPAGYAVIGQFQNAVAMITSFASGALNTGVVKYTAEHFDDESRQRLVWKTAGTIAILSSLLVSIVVAIFRVQLAEYFLKRSDFSGVFVWFAVTLLFFILNALLLAILNGKKEVRLYVIANIVGNLLSACFVASLATIIGLYGALVAIVVYQPLNFIVTLIICSRAKWFRFKYLWGEIHKDTVRKLGKYIVMALTSSIVGPLSQITVRNHLVSKFGWQETGYWEAVTKISDMYLMLITTTLSVYYLPRLSEIRGGKELKREILQGYKVILPASMLLAATIYFSRCFITTTLFSAAFAPMQNLYLWQLLGDVVKVASWLCGYVLVGKALTKSYIFTEVIFSALFVFFTYILTPFFGIQGASMAFLCNFVVHFITMLCIVGFYINKEETI
jgi:PST family polysaccharide transporter